MFSISKLYEMLIGLQVPLFNKSADGQTGLIVGGIKYGIDDAICVYRGVGTPGVTDQTTTIRAFYLAAGSGAKLVFQRNVDHVISGRIPFLDGQEIIDFGYKKAPQVQTTTTAQVNQGATSIPVTDRTLFAVGNSIAITSVGFVSGSNSGQPLQYSINGNEIESITAGAGNTGTLNLVQALQLYDPTGANVTSLPIGSRVVTAYAAVSNRREAGSTPFDSISFTRLRGDGNSVSMDITAWNLIAEYDMVSNCQELLRPKLLNSGGESMVLSGSNIYVSSPQIQGAKGNGIHLSAYTSALGTDRVTIDAPDVSNCNGDIAAWYCPSGIGAVTFSNGSPTVTWTSGTAPANDTPVNLTTSGTLPTNFAVNTYYYVVNSSGATSNLSATVGGSAISAASAGGGTHAARLISLPTNRPSADRFISSPNIGHRGGAIVLSNNAYNTRISGGRLFNSRAGVAQIDSLDNSRITLDGILIEQCGSADDGSATSTPVGGLAFGGDQIIGAPEEITISGCRLRNCYRSWIGSSSSTASPTVNMDENWFVNSPVLYKDVVLNHTSGTYIEPVGITGMDNLIWVLDNVKGILSGVRATGGQIGALIEGTNTAGRSLDCLIGGNVWTDQFSTAIQLKSGSTAGIPRAVIGQNSIYQTDSRITSWSGITAASGGGYAIKINAPGPIVIDAQQTSGGATMKGIRYENATGADIVSDSVFGNVRAHMGNASHLAITCKAGSGFKMKNVTFGAVQVYPDFVDAATAGWDATVTFGAKTVLPA